MNLQQYDEVNNVIDKNKSWINVASKKLFSREIVYKKFAAIRKRYEPSISDDEYYLILCDNIPPGSYCRVYVDDYGRIKIPMNSIWEEVIKTATNPKKDFSISIEYIESDDDSDTYKLLI